jgi:hypothetical protein
MAPYGQSFSHLRHFVQRLSSMRTMPSGRFQMASVEHCWAQTGVWQWKHETER